VGVRRTVRIWASVRGMRLSVSVGDVRERGGGRGGGGDVDERSILWVAVLCRAGTVLVGMAVMDQREVGCTVREQGCCVLAAAAENDQFRIDDAVNYTMRMITHYY